MHIQLSYRRKHRTFPSAMIRNRWVNHNVILEVSTPRILKELNSRRISHFQVVKGQMLRLGPGQQRSKPARESQG